MVHLKTRRDEIAARAARLHPRKTTTGESRATTKTYCSGLGPKRHFLMDRSFPFFLKTPDKRELVCFSINHTYGKRIRS